MPTAGATRGRRQEVWAKALWIVLDIAEQANVPSAGLLEGMPFDVRTARKLRRVGWDDYVTVADRLEDALGGSEALSATCETAFPAVTPELRKVVGSVVSVKTMLRLFTQIFNPLVFPPLEFVYEDRGPASVRIEIWERAGVRRCRSYYSASLGIIRGMPRHLDLRPAEVVGTMAEDHMAFDIAVPLARRSGQFAREASRATGAFIARVMHRLVLGYDDEGVPIGAATDAPVAAPRASPAKIEERLALAIRRWSLTPRQVDVLEILAQGKSNKEIASALACAENTVELHVTHLLRRAGASSRAEVIARFWSDAASAS